VAEAGKEHGFLVEIDWVSKEVTRLVEAPPLYSQLGTRNRGGRRGLRGITRFGERIWFAACDALYGLEPKTLQLDKIISHPWMSQMHEIVAGQDGIWVTATGGNGVFLVGLNQQVLEAAWLTGEPADDLRVHFESERDKFHLNTVFEKEGIVYAYSKRTGQVFQMFPGAPTEVLTLEKGCHNVVLTELGWFRNDSANTRVLVGERSMTLPRQGLGGEFTQPGWLRGMARFANGNFLVGSSPASLYEIDPKEMKVVSSMSLTDDVRWTIHGVWIEDEAEILRPEIEELKATRRRLNQLTAHSNLQRSMRVLTSGVVQQARRQMRRVKKIWP
jgi:hypothetical protein